VEAYQQVPDPQPTHQQDADAYWADKIAEVMRDQFGIKPKVNAYSYRTPYPPAYDLILLPNQYNVPDFTKFSGQDDTSTMEHSNRFIIQCGEAANRDELTLLQNEALVDAQNHQKPRPFCGPGLKAPLTPVRNTNRC